jgi:hypothetical protein
MGEILKKYGQVYGKYMNSIPILERILDRNLQVRNSFKYTYDKMIKDV